MMGTQRKLAFSIVGQPKVYVPMILLALLGALPIFVENPFYVNLLVMICFYGAASGAWNLIGGYGNQLSLGHAAFFGIGAYTSTLLYLDLGISPWIGIWVGAILAVIMSIIIGYPCFRLRGPFFALATLAVVEVLRILAIHFRELTAGGVGLPISYAGKPVNFIFQSKITYFYIAFAFMLIVIGITIWFEKSKWGYYLKALGDDEDAAEAVGVHSIRVKLLAMVVSAFLTAMCGTFMAQFGLILDPDIAFSFNYSIQVAIVSIIGGVATVAGPILGALLLTPLDVLLRSWLGGLGAGGSQLIYGIILVTVVIFLPYGIWTVVRKKYEVFLKKLPNFYKPATGDKLKVPVEAASSAIAEHARKIKKDVPLLMVKNLTKAFGGLKAVDALDFSVNKGEIVGLIGPNGAGKTTVFNLLTGFLKPDHGEILIGGKKIRKGSRPSRICKRGFGRTFQIVKPFKKLTALENVMVGGFSHSADVPGVKDSSLAILSDMGLLQYRDALGENLTLLHRKRMEIARALATKPTLLLLDEVMAGLRPSEVDEAIRLVNGLRDQGITIILVEHLMKAVMTLCDRIIVVNYGKKLAQGTPSEIGKNKKVIDAYLGEEN